MSINAKKLWKIGAKVKVDLELLKTRLANTSVDRIPEEPYGIVTDYKMTDGQGIGCIVKFPNDYSFWFFDNEINSYEEEEVQLFTSLSPKRIEASEDYSPIKSQNQLTSISIERGLIKDTVPQEILDTIIKQPNAKFIDYKMTDGNGIGMIVELENGIKTWFFEDEIHKGDSLIKFKSKNEIDSQIVNKSIVKKQNSLLIGDKVPDLLNPKNFISWLIFSIKDIV